MASGCPCIVADTGGLREVVPNEDVGLRFRSRDPRSLAQMMEWVLANPALRFRLVTEASAHVARFDWADVARRTDEVYDALAARGQAPPGDAGAHAVVRARCGAARREQHHRGKGVRALRGCLARRRSLARRVSGLCLWRQARRGAARDERVCPHTARKPDTRSRASGNAPAPASRTARAPTAATPPR